MIKKIIFLGIFIIFTVSTLVYAFSERGEESPLVEDPQIIAHRGANDRFNEHTLTAYKIAAQDGVDALEIDLRMTKDGELVAMHDQTIDRTTNGTGNVSDYTLEELKSFRTTGSYGNKTVTEEIPTLKEIIQTFSATEHYYIETRLVDGQLKMEEPLIRLLNEYDLIEQGLVTLQSFSKESLDQIKQLAPDVPLTLLYKKGDFDLKEAQAADYPIIGIEATDVTRKIVNELHKKGKQVHVYFTNRSTQKTEQKRVKKYGVDGYFTDFIPYTKQLLGDE